MMVSEPIKQGYSVWGSSQKMGNGIGHHNNHLKMKYYIQLGRYNEWKI